MHIRAKDRMKRLGITETILRLWCVSERSNDNLVRLDLLLWKRAK
jgi:hypothetical protein